MSLPEIDLSQGTFIDIGAGTAPGLEALLEAPGAPARVILVEPHAATAKALASRFAAFPQVTVLDVAVGAAAASGVPVLRVTSDLAHSSLYPPLPVLRALLPGLRMSKPQPVEVVSGEDLLHQLGELAHPVHVRIDAPGSERDILASLLGSGGLDRIDSLDLRAGSEPLYESAVAAAALKDWLIEQGFLLNEVSNEDPDWPEARLVADRSRRDLQRKLAEAELETASQNAELAELAAVRIQLEHQLVQRDAAIAAARQEAKTAAERNVDIEAALATTTQELEARTRTLAQVEKVARDATAALDAAEAEALSAKAAAAAALAASEARVEELATLATARGDKLAEVEEALETTTQALAEETKALTEARAALDQANAAAETAKAAASAAQGAAEAKIKELTSLATARAGQIADAQQALVGANQGLVEKTKALDAAKAALDQANAAAETAKAAASAAQSISEAKVKELTETATARANKIVELERGLAASTQSLTETKAALTEAKTALAQTSAAAEAAKAAASASQVASAAKIQELTTLAAARASKIAEVEQALQVATQGLGDKAKALGDVKAALDQSNAALVSAKATAAASHSASEAKVKELTDLAATRASKIVEVERSLSSSSQALTEAKAALTQANAAAEAAKAAAGTAQTAAAAKMQELNTLATDRAAKIAEVEQALQAATQELAGKAEALTQAKAALKEANAAAETAALTAANAAAAARLAFATEIKDLSDLSDARAHKLVELEQALAVSRDKAETGSKALVQAETQLRQSEERSQTALQKQTKLAEAAEAEVARARQDLLVALRLQAIAVGDLRDLQVRFAETLDIKSKQEELLRQLTPRLQEASAQLRELMVLPAAPAVKSISTPKPAPVRRKPKAVPAGGKAKAGETS